MFDLYLLTIHLAAGQNLPELPGVLIIPAPARCERSRAGDLLVAHLSLSGKILPEPTAFDRLLKDMAASYFNARGPATAGLRQAVEHLNDTLLQSNLKSSQQGIQLLGQLNLAVLRKEALYLIQAGPTQAFLITKDEVKSYGDVSASGHSLGQSRSINPQYYQANIEAGDMLVFSPKPPANWIPTPLSGTTQQAFEQLRRRLTSQAEDNLQAAVVQFQEGRGTIHRLRPRLTTPENENQNPKGASGVGIEPARPPTIAENPAQPPVMNQPGNNPPAIDQKPAAAAVKIQPTARPAQKVEPPPGSVSYVPPPLYTPARRVDIEDFRTDSTQRSAENQPVQTEGIYLSGEKLKDVPQTGGAHPMPPSEKEKPAAAPSKPGSASQPAPSRRTGTGGSATTTSPLQKLFAGVWFAGHRLVSGIAKFIPNFLQRMLPLRGQPSQGLSPSTMLFISIAVPVIIGAIATTIYFQSGRSEQHLAYLQQAKIYAFQAQGQADSITQHNLWLQGLEWLNRADQYGRSDDSRTLRQQIQQALDRYDGVSRLNMTPAANVILPTNTHITEMAATQNGDVYLLNQTEGRVLRLILTARGFELDSQFNCGPGLIGGILEVGKLVDIIPKEPTNAASDDTLTKEQQRTAKASVIGIDSGGNLLYCIPGAEPVVSPLTPPNSTGWGNITTITKDAVVDDLYVVDSGAKSLVYFDGKYNLFLNEPHNAFDNYVPQGLDKIDDIAVNEDLFILYSDGKMAWCTQRNSAGKVDCQDPAAFIDARPTHNSEIAVFPNTKFTRLLATQPPDPALYITEQGESSIYLFTLKLNLQNVMKPQFSEDTIAPTQPISAFTIAPGQIAVLAFGNQIFSAPLQ